MEDVQDEGVSGGASKTKLVKVSRRYWIERGRSVGLASCGNNHFGEDSATPRTTSSPGRVSWKIKSLRAVRIFFHSLTRLGLGIPGLVVG